MNMFAGEGDRNYPTQWALNPSAYQNMSNDQVDWAALAQQWIMMKETCPPDQVPPAPPPPSIGPVKKDTGRGGVPTNEGGEAPMEVENEKEDADEPPASWTGPANGPGSWNWSQQQQWGWNSNWSGTPGTTTSPVIVPGKTALLPTPFGFPDTTASNQGFSGSRSNSYPSGYWSNHDPTRNKNNKKSTRVDSDDDVDTSSMTLDAAKRRQLPAWIREGLEKMEREKQKQLDKEREAKEREEFMKLKKQEVEEVRKVMTDSGLVTLPSKSKFESDSDEDGGSKEDVKGTKKPKVLSGTRSREPVEIEVVRTKSREERMQDIMLQVRRMMTEVLLDVTTTEIENIAQEELKRYRASASAMNLRKTPALASLTGKLGLGIYGESASSDSESEHSNGEDSDSALKETIRRRKAEFARTEREIEARAMEAERRQAEQERLHQEREEQVPTKEAERYSQVETTNSHHGYSDKTITVRKSRFHDASETPTIETKQPEPQSKFSSSSRSSSSDSKSSTDRRSESVRSGKVSSKTNGSRRKSSRRRSRSRSDSRSYYRSRSRSYDRYSSRSKHSSSRDHRRERSYSRDRHRRNRSRSRDNRHRSPAHSRSGRYRH